MAHIFMQHQVVDYDAWRPIFDGDASNRRALRALASRLVGILHGCLRHHTVYDEHTAWAHRINLAARHLPPVGCLGQTPERDEAPSVAVPRRFVGRSCEANPPMGGDASVHRAASRST
jgi:hypothetical protein